MALDQAMIDNMRDMLERYDLGVQEDYVEGGEGIFYGDGGVAEHVIHEIAHARLLGVRLGPKLSQRVSIAITKTGEDAWEEAKAWAVEWHCIQALGMKFELGDCIEGGNIQGCAPGDIEKYYADPESARYAESVLKHLRKV